MARPVVLSLYALLIVIWSSTWVAIKFGLEETPPLLGAGVRFVLAGAGLLVLARAQRRALNTDRALAGILALLPFAATYGLVYWSEQYIPSGLAAVLFGVLPLYVGVLAVFLLDEETVGPRLFAGVAVALAGLGLAFGESIALGHAERAALGAAAGLLAPLASAIGNISLKRRGGRLDAVVLNGWAMWWGGVALLAASAVSEDWGEAAWTAQAIAAIGYLAVFGSAVAFVVLTLLLRELTAIVMSYLPLILPFGALLFGWGLYDEPLTLASLAGAALVVVGLLVAQWPVARPAGPEPATVE